MVREGTHSTELDTYPLWRTIRDAEEVLQRVALKGAEHDEP